MSRFSNRTEIVTNEFVSQLLKSRGDKQVTILSSPNIGSVKESDYNNLSVTYHTWKQGDKLYKLANDYYGDSSLWWVIGWFNKKPIDTLYNFGDTVEIPFPIQNVLAIYRRVNQLNV